MSTPDNNPLYIPETLLHVYDYLDPPDLFTCARVSHLWREWFLSYHTAALVPNEDALACFARKVFQRIGEEDDEDEDSTATASKTIRTADRHQSLCFRELTGRVSKLTSLTVGNRWDEESRIRPPRSRDEWTSSIPAGLTNLEHLAFTPDLFDTTPGLPQKILADLLLQNPGINSLDFTSSRHMAPVLNKILRRLPLEHLRRLSVHGIEGTQFAHLFASLVLRSSRQEAQRRVISSTRAGLIGFGNEDWLASRFQREDDETLAGLGTLPNMDLEELVVKNEGVSPNRPRAGLEFFRPFVAQSIRAPLEVRLASMRRFIIWNVDMRQDQFTYGQDLSESNARDAQPIHQVPVLFHLLHCFPKLERLTVSPDPSKIREPLPEPIQDRIRASYHDLDIGAEDLVTPSGSLAHHITRLCRRLKSIDLSHHNELRSQDWYYLLQVCAPQLESLVCWNVKALPLPSLLELIPPSLTIFHSIGVGGNHQSQTWIGLQELDVSANPKAGSVIHMFFKNVPTLRILRALGVPVNATRMAGFDWVCKDMELLAVNLFIPQSNVKPRIRWEWERDSGNWAARSNFGENSVDLEYWLTTEGESFGSILVVGDHNTAVDEEGGQVGDDGHADEIIDAPTMSHSVRIQRQICWQLGRLTKMKELTLEGYHGSVDVKEDQLIDCLHLTLETGLDYLRPLQANLEKLVVYQLDEELCGRAEVEWIAQYWVHHDNPVWQNEFQARKAAKDQPGMEVDQERSEIKPLLLPFPKFKELHGIDVRGRESGFSESEANENVVWLEQQCPRLLVFKEDVNTPKIRTRFDSLLLAL